MNYSSTCTELVSASKKQTVMTTIIKIIIATLLSLTLFSCNLDFGAHGNGNVQLEERPINNPFTTIKATKGLTVYITQGNQESILVEADENLQELILTDIENNVLKIHTKENIGYATSKKITVTFKDISKIISTSGSDVYSTNTISTENLTIKTTSGSNMKLDVNASSLYCESSSGSNLGVSGKTNNLIAVATSGSDIKARNLMAISCEVKATSGADITINTSKELIAKATSGGDIKYFGNPEKVDVSDNSAGNIRKN